MYSNTVWLLYGNGIPSIQAFTNPNNDPDMAESMGPMLREEIEKAGYNIRYTQDASEIREDIAALISWDVTPDILRNVARLPRERCFLLAFEPPTICPLHYSEITKSRFGKIFVWFDDMIDNENYFKFHCPYIFWYRGPAKDLPDFSEKKLCCLMNGNKYWGEHPNELNTERLRAIKALTPTGDFDLYGRGWDGFASWKGVAPYEGLVFKHYKFAIRYENFGNCRGFIADKIFPALLGRTVPVYLGATNITDYVPKECFVDKREFSSYDDLYKFMKNMDRETHEAYLAAGLDYIQSPKKDLFTGKDVVQRIMKQFLSLNQRA